MSLILTYNTVKCTFLPSDHSTDLGHADHVLGHADHVLGLADHVLGLADHVLGRGADDHVVAFWPAG